MAAALAGGVIAFYQLGYGIAAFGVGPLLDAGVTMPTIYGGAAIVAVAMGMVSFGSPGRRPCPHSLRLIRLLDVRDPMSTRATDEDSQPGSETSP